MKKVFLIIATILAFVIVLCTFNYKWIYYRFYPFDRITGKYEITVNNKEVYPVEEYYEYENDGRIRLTNDTENFRIKGGSYGKYDIGFVLSDEVLYNLTNDEKFKDCGDIDLSIAYLNTNWWHISEIDIDIDIVKENGEWYVCYDLELEEPTENFQIKTSKVSKKIKMSEIDSVGIMIGM